MLFVISSWRLKVASLLCFSLILWADACAKGGVSSLCCSCKISGRFNKSTCSTIVTASNFFRHLFLRINIFTLFSCPAPSYHVITVFKGHLKRLKDDHFNVAIWLPTTKAQHHCLPDDCLSFLGVIWSFVLSTRLCFLRRFLALCYRTSTQEIYNNKAFQMKSPKMIKLPKDD